MIQAFGPEARGSACSAQVIVDSEPIAYPYVKRVSILVALNQEVYERFESQLNDDGILIYESEMVTLPGDRRRSIREFAVPAARIAEELGWEVVEEGWTGESSALEVSKNVLAREHELLGYAGDDVLRFAGLDDISKGSEQERTQPSRT